MINKQYHHMGIPTKIVQKNERYSSTFKMYSTPGDNLFRIQWHRFEEDCPLHPLIQTKVHIAFKVDDLTEALKGQTILLDPYYPMDNFQVAMIEFNGSPIEFIQTSLSEKDIWQQDHKGSIIYPELD